MIKFYSTSVPRSNHGPNTYFPPSFEQYLLVYPDNTQMHSSGNIANSEELCLGLKSWSLFTPASNPTHTLEAVTINSRVSFSVLFSALVLLCKEHIQIHSLANIKGITEHTFFFLLFAVLLKNINCV